MTLTKCKCGAIPLLTDSGVRYIDTLTSIYKHTLDGCTTFDLRASAPAPVERRPAQRTLPCGCVMCVCADDDRCHGCGARYCPTHAPAAPVESAPSRSPLPQRAKRQLRGQALTDALRRLNPPPALEDMGLEAPVESAPGACLDCGEPMREHPMTTTDGDRSWVVCAGRARLCPECADTGTRTFGGGPCSKGCRAPASPPAETFYAGPDTPEIRDLFAAAERMLRAPASPPAGDCTKCEGTDGPGTGTPLPCPWHPAPASPPAEPGCARCGLGSDVHPVRKILLGPPPQEIVCREHVPPAEPPPAAEPGTPLEREARASTRLDGDTHCVDEPGTCLGSGKPFSGGLSVLLGAGICSVCDEQVDATPIFGVAKKHPPGGTGRRDTPRSVTDVFSAVARGEGGSVTIEDRIVGLRKFLAAHVPLAVYAEVCIRVEKEIREAASAPAPVESAPPRAFYPTPGKDGKCTCGGALENRYHDGSAYLRCRQCGTIHSEPAESAPGAGIPPGGWIPAPTPEQWTGNPASPPAAEPCLRCGGSGNVPDATEDATFAPCRACGGTGRRDTQHKEE